MHRHKHPINMIIPSRQRMYRCCVVEKERRRVDAENANADSAMVSAEATRQSDAAMLIVEAARTQANTAIIAAKTPRIQDNKHAGGSIPRLPHSTRYI